MADISPGPCGETTGALERCTRSAEFVICHNADVDYGTRACGRHLLAAMRFRVADLGGLDAPLAVHILPEGRIRA